ncbi:MAG TPA: MlaD family protein [Candidatus Kapabacteria bacterium]|nr:MlaD family protein [Candidatus Kapabacteria bacterium]
MSQRSSLRWRDLKTGIVFTIGLLVVGWLGLFIGKNTGLLEGHKYVKIFVKDIKGLTESNLVAISGKKVGVVEEMVFTRERDTNGILMTLKIRAEHFHLITEDTRAMIKSLGVLGDKYVDLSLGQSTKQLADGGRIYIGEDPDDLMASATSTMKNIDLLTSKISQGEGSIGQLFTTTELTDRVSLTLANLSTLLNATTNGKGIAPGLLNDPELASSVRSMLANLNSISDAVKGGDGAAGKFFLGDHVFSSINGLSNKTDSLLTQLGNKNGSLAKFSQDEEVYTNVNSTITTLKHTVGSLDSLLVDLKSNPSKYINVKIIDF